MRRERYRRRVKSGILYRKMSYSGNVTSKYYKWVGFINKSFYCSGSGVVDNSSAMSGNYSLKYCVSGSDNETLCKSGKFL